MINHLRIKGPYSLMKNPLTGFFPIPLKPASMSKN